MRGGQERTCQEVDKVLKVLQDCWAEGYAAQGDCLVADDLAPAVWIPEWRIGDCTANLHHTLSCSC